MFDISEYYLEHMNDPAPIRRSRSISRSFRNLFRSSSKKKANVAKTDALGEYENGKPVSFFRLIT